MEKRRAGPRGKVGRQPEISAKLSVQLDGVSLHRQFPIEVAEIDIPQLQRSGRPRERIPCSLAGKTRINAIAVDADGRI